MKKTFLAMVLLGGSTAIWAQVQGTTTDSTKNTTNNATGTTTNTTTNGVNTTNTMNGTNTNTMNNTNNGSNNNMNSTDYNSQRSTANNYNAYGTATNVPTAVNMSFAKENPTATDARWEQSNNWWRVNYKNNGEDMNMYYGPNGQSFAIALPVRQNLVPENVVDKAKSMYGYNIYDITTMKGHGDAMYYSVRVMENGEMRTEKINEDGSVYVDTAMANMNGTMENNSMNNGTNMNMNSNTNSTNMNSTMDSTATQQMVTDSTTDTTGAMNNNMNNTDNSSTSNTSTLNQGTSDSSSTTNMTTSDANLNTTTNSTNSNKKSNKKIKE